MSHDDLKELVLELGDAELEAPRRAEAEAHLTACPECRGLLQAWRRSRAALFAPSPAPTRQETELFARAVMERTAARPSPWAWLVPTIGLAFAAAAVIVAAPPSSSDPLDALLEGRAALQAWVAQTAPSTPDDLLAFAGEER